MRLNRRITGALAWGGLILILGVPSAEIISANVQGPVAPGAGAGNDPAETASAETASIVTQPAAAQPSGDSVDVATVTPASVSAPAADPVESYLQSGKPLPDYISDDAGEPPTRVIPGTGAPAVPQAPAVAATPPASAPAAQPAPAQTAAAPASPPQTPATAAPSTVETASLPAAPAVAPVPMPASMRPAPRNHVVFTAPQAALPQAAPPPVILDEEEALSREASTRPVPPASIPEPYVPADQLEGWRSGTLADYLARNNLLSDDQPRNRQAGFEQDDAYDEYDPDGFFLDEGPNRSDRRYRGQPPGFIVFPAD